MVDSSTDPYTYGAPVLRMSCNTCRETRHVLVAVADERPLRAELDLFFDQHLSGSVIDVRDAGRIPVPATQRV